ncbi:MAG: bifunctional oligoribonuclease/PAP phosphatase NrnA [Ignavibacteriales bacterium]|nr:MAG: bifunctional oligoribonuclease/PAP phosphatase NrnA [Ignavibacteriales bacterium]
MVDFLLLEKIIRENNYFLLTTHVNPDADAIGAEVALYFLLKELGKDVCIVNHSQTPYNLQFLDTENRIEKYNPQVHSDLFDKSDILVALDFNRSDRMVSMAKSFNASGKTKICIDHHQDPENFADYYFLDAGYSATGHILFDFIKKTNIIKLSYKTAYPIYAAIMTDTGSFRFERTTPEIHRIAAELIELNVDPSDVFDKIYDQSLFSKMKLLGKALDSLTLYGEKKQIAYMVITKEMFRETGALESDTDGFVNFSLSVEFVKIGLMFIELNEGFKVSFRSKGLIPVHKLAGEFGGGGHLNAAGARIFKGTMNDFISVILKRTEEYL